jgi:hypothetical protein
MSDSLACRNYRTALHENGTSLPYKLGLSASGKIFEAQIGESGKLLVQAFSTDTFSVGKHTKLIISLTEGLDLKKKFEIEVPWPEDRWDNPRTQKDNDYEKYLPLKIWAGNHPPSAEERKALLETLKKIPMKPTHTLLQRTIGLLENCRFVERY